MGKCVHVTNVDGYHPHHGCLDRPFTPEEIPTITEIPPENNQVKEIKLTVTIKGECWCWLCKSHGPEKICPRKDEIDTEYGRQRLKELLQEMVKPQERLGVELDRNGATPEVDQEAWFLETPSYSTEKGELVGPKIVQPPQGKTPHIKPVELGGGAQWPTKPTTTTPSKSPGNAVGQSPTKLSQKSTAGSGGTRDDQEEEQFPPRPPPRGNSGGEGGGDGNGGGGGDDDGDDDDEEEDKDDEDTETLTVKMGKNKMCQEEEVVEVMNHHLIQGVEMWDLEVEGDTEAKEDDEVGQVHRVYQVHRGHRDLKALRV